MAEKFFFVRGKKKVSFSLDEVRLLASACSYLEVHDFLSRRKRALAEITRKLNKLQGWA